ncbi:hypothetical protein, partial [Salmonella sp. gx-f5]|uniref:hypothetical protein n=1 Tax=Salmonella sp. gx-f5 TaxID=2582605 RepID=UPI001F37340D
PGKNDLSEESEITSKPSSSKEDEPKAVEQEDQAKAEPAPKEEAPEKAIEVPAPAPGKLSSRFPPPAKPKADAPAKI